MNGYWNRCTALPISGSECRATRHSPYLHRLAGPAFIPLGGHPRTQHLSRLTTNPAFIPLGANPVFIPLGANPGFIPLGARQILNLVRKESLPPLAGEGGRRPEGGNTKPAFIPLGANPGFIPLGTNPVFTPLGGSRRNSSSTERHHPICRIQRLAAMCDHNLGDM